MSAKKRFAIGVDLGATTIKTGAVDKEGVIFDQLAVDSYANKGPNTVVRQISSTIEQLFRKHRSTECFGIGIGSPGVVMTASGSVLHPPNFSDWAEVPLTTLIRKAFPMPVFVENDANAAAIAEAKYGAGVKQKDFLFVIWGTGVGGGIIVGGKIYRGPFGGAGEIGHVSIDYEGRECNCGGRGCIESYIGQRYLSERTRDILRSSERGEAVSMIEELVEGNLNKIEPSIITQAAQQGDRRAIEIMQEAGELLGAALASVLNVLDLRVVVVGGGISAAPNFVFEAIEKSLRARVLKPHKGNIRVLRATLGNAAGIIGAASLAM